MKILAITRDSQFSPNSVEKDLAIIQMVAAKLRDAGYQVDLVAEATVINICPKEADRYDHILSMGRLPQTLDWLSAYSDKTINTAAAVRICSSRNTILQLMSQYNIPAPPDSGRDKGYWLKRGDGWTLHSDDIRFCQDRAALEAAIQLFNERGVNDYVISTHVEGDLIKFYGVRGTDFFRCYYPSDNGQTKFGLECHNGQPHHYNFSISALCHDANQLATATGIYIYGGDAIIRSNGTYCIIDFNDWPSFSPCRNEAADAIIQLMLRPKDPGVSHNQQSAL